MAGNSADRERVPRIPTQADYQGRRRSRENEESDSFWCGVCVSHVGKPEKIRGTIDCCHHCFCLDCILGWAKRSSYCPICRLPFTTIYGPSNPVVFVSRNNVNVPQSDQITRQQVVLGNNARPRHNYISSPTNSEKSKCRVCKGAADEIQRRLLCDVCDSAVHTACIGLSNIPVPDASWFCLDCAFNINFKLPISFGNNNNTSSIINSSNVVRGRDWSLS